MTARRRTAREKPAGTRIYRRPYATGAYCLTVSVSFHDLTSALEFATQINAHKSRAAVNGTTLSRELLVALLARAAKRKARA